MMRPSPLNTQRRNAHRLLAALMLALACGSAPAKPSANAVEAVRQAEMASCQAGEVQTWGDGQDRPAPSGRVTVIYRHAGAPTWFSEAKVRDALEQALVAWSGCGVPSGLRPADSNTLKPEDVIAAWDDASTQGNFALADVGRRRLWLSAAMFRLLAERNPRHPAEQTLQMTVSHELGHFYGLMAHSRRCVDVMSYYRDGQGNGCSTRGGVDYRALPEYRALLPTACDLARCRAINTRP